MPKTVRAYISTFRPTKFDEMPKEIYKPLRKMYRWAYGVKIFADDEQSNIASSWVKSKEPMLPHVTGLANLLTTIEELDETIRIEIYTRTAHFETRIRQNENRLRKKQRGESVADIKDEEIWEDTTLRLQPYERGMREGIEEHEIRELKAIEDALKNEFYSGTRFSSANPPEFQLFLRDDRSFAS